MSKAERLLELARKRHLARWPGYASIGDFHDGIYECDHVSPYTKSAGNVDALVMILLQDWSSAERLSGPVDPDARDIGHTPNLPTNRNLTTLLRAHFGLELHEVYATNLFPFVKAGGMSSGIPKADLVRAAREFTIPQIEIVEPELVVCLGADVFEAIRRARGLPRLARMEERIATPFTIGESQIWCQASTGQLGRNNRNSDGIDRVTSDWKRMAASCSPRGVPIG